MVRIGTLPMRLLALEYGAGKTLHLLLTPSQSDLVYSPEIVDKRLIATTRIENSILPII